MGRTTVAKFFALAATTAALVVFGASAAQAETSTPAVTSPATPLPSPTATDNNPWD